MIQIIDDRKGWRDRVLNNDVDVNTLSSKWDKIKTFINDHPECSIVIRLDVGGTGMMAVNHPTVGRKTYTLSIMPNGTVSFYGT